MKFLRVGGVLAGVMMLAPLAATSAGAAEIHPTAVAAPSFVSDDCYYTHHWDGRWHRRVRLVCDDDNNYYYGGNDYYRGNRGGNFDRGNRGGNFDRGNRGGNFDRGNRGGNFNGGNRGNGNVFRGNNTGGGNTGGHGHR